MEKEKILQKVNLKQNFGIILNHIQKVACENLPEKSIDRFLTAASKDAEACDGMDCIILNNQVFDWRQFDKKTKEIVLAYLDYFTENEIKIIYSKL